ncbi:MAG: phospholipase D-like domain-containing protein [Leptospira sp.]|nr:phospholipase D-like domain-containing protein [Leptospira sp.]
MKLIKDSKTLVRNLNQLIDEYSEFHWMVAWAGEASPVIENLKKNRKKIKKIVVGIHFYQTHPNFIESFLGDKGVRYLMQPDGTFHPKVYLFRNSDSDWRLIIGSANFTRAALKRNTEVNVLIEPSDLNAQDMYQDILVLIHENWLLAKRFTGDELRRYIAVRSTQIRKIQSLSGLYSSEDETPRPIFDINSLSMDWNEFVKKVKLDKTHGLDKRLRVLEISRNLFETRTTLDRFQIEERKFVSGAPNNLATKGSEHWAYFGSMKGAGDFKGKMNRADDNLTNALNEIPLTGAVLRNDFQNFTKHFTKSMSVKSIATATRLLAMKRPDYFLCLDSKNKKLLFEDFGIRNSNLSFEGYWDQIIERIMDSPWWNAPMPKNATEIAIYKGRVALMDCFYYAES